MDINSLSLASNIAHAAWEALHDRRLQLKNHALPMMEHEVAMGRATKARLLAVQEELREAEILTRETAAMADYLCGLWGAAYCAEGTPPLLDVVAIPLRLPGRY